MENKHILTPYFLDQRSPGLDSMAEPGWKINKVILPNVSVQQRMITIYRQLKEALATSIRPGQRPVCLAGDCCTSIGFLAGLQRVGLDPTKLWFDAHGDFNDWKTSPSGFLGGMPLAMLVGRGEQTMPQCVELQRFDENKVILSDARDLDPGERDALNVSELILLREPGAFLEDALPIGSLYVHFDVDIIDPQHVPAVSYPAPGGPSPEILREIFRRLARTNRVIGVSFAAWNPELPGAGRSRAIVMELL